MSDVIQQATKQQEKMTLKQYVGSMQGEIVKALPAGMTAERFTRITLSALSKNPKLQECTPTSFLAAMMTAAQLGLEPNTPLGQAYLIPYKNKGIAECQFQIGFKGLIDLAYRSGEVSMIEAHTVYDDDEFDFQYGIETKLIHVPCLEEKRGEPVAFYAILRTKDGGCGFDVMSVSEAREHAKRYSAANGDGGPWKTHFEEMAKKTVLKRLLKYAPLRTDYLGQDETIRHGIATDMSEMESDRIVLDDAEIS